jgi:hypothetical protein
MNSANAFHAFYLSVIVLVLYDCHPSPVTNAVAWVIAPLATLLFVGRLLHRMTYHPFDAYIDWLHGVVWDLPLLPPLIIAAIGWALVLL